MIGRGSNGGLLCGWYVGGIGNRLGDCCVLFLARSCFSAHYVACLGGACIFIWMTWTMAYGCDGRWDRLHFYLDEMDDG